MKIKANNATQAAKELKAEGLTLDQLNISDQINDHDANYSHFICIEAKQVGLSMELSARVVQIGLADVKRGNGVNAAMFQKVVLLHDCMKKPAKAKATTANK